LYSDREEFREEIKRDGLLNEHNLKLGGDLKFTSSNREMWGLHARVDPLQLFFIHMIQVEGVVDVDPIKILPTWRNGRGGHEYIAKRLNQFLIIEYLALSGLRYKSWVSNSKIFLSYANDSPFGTRYRKVLLSF